MVRDSARVSKCSDQVRQSASIGLPEVKLIGPKRSKKHHGLKHTIPIHEASGAGRTTYSPELASTCKYATICDSCWSGRRDQDGMPERSFPFLTNETSIAGCELLTYACRAG